MAKDLVRTRRYVKKFILMKANIQAVSLKITTLKSTNTMANAMKGVTKAMSTMNKQVQVYNNFMFVVLGFRVGIVMIVTRTFLSQRHQTVFSHCCQVFI